MMHSLTLQAASPLASLTAGLTPAVGSPALSFSDLSPHARVGFRGRHAAEMLQQQGLCLPERPNQALRQADGSLVARLSQTEYLLLADDVATSARLQALESGWQLSDRACYLLPRADTHAWIALRGEALAEMMAKLCAVDLSAAAFPPGAVAQTSVARATALVINASQGDSPQFWLLVDVSLAAYFWSVLLDASAEFGGLPTA